MNTDNNYNNSNIETEVVSAGKLLKNGYRFCFQDGENTINCRGSSVSGKEIISLNDEQVSTNRNAFSRRSLHKFASGSHNYEVEFYMASLLKGELHCILIKDGVHVETKKACPSGLTNNKPISPIRTFIEGFIFGFIGFGIGYFMSDWLSEEDKPIEVIGALIEPIKLFFS